MNDLKPNDRHAVNPLADLLDSIPFGLVTLKANGTIAYVNSIAHHMLDGDDRKLINNDFIRIVHTEDVPHLQTHWEKVRETNILQACVVKLVKANGTFIHVSINSLASYDKGKDGPQWKLFLLDISQQYQHDAQISLQTKINETVSDIGTKLTNAAPHKLYDNTYYALDKLCNLLQVDRGFVGFFNNGDPALKPLFEWCKKGVSPCTQELSTFSFTPFKEDLNRLKKGNPILFQKFDNYTEDDIFLTTFFLHRQCRSAIVMPITTGTQLIGILGIETEKTHQTWTNQIVFMIETISLFITNMILKFQAEKKQYEITKKYKNLQQNIRLRPGLKRNRQCEKKFSFEDLIIDTKNLNQPIINRPIIVLHDPNTTINIWKFERGKHSVILKEFDIFPDHKNQVEILCPACTLKKNLPANIFQGYSYPIKVTCPCQYMFCVRLNMRIHPRRVTQLDGLYAAIESENIWKKINIVNISRGGLGLICEIPHSIKSNQKLKIKFALDDFFRSVLVLDVFVKLVHDDYIGCALISPLKHQKLLSGYC